MILISYKHLKGHVCDFWAQMHGDEGVVGVWARQFYYLLFFGCSLNKELDKNDSHGIPCLRKLFANFCCKLAAKFSLWKIDPLGLWRKVPMYVFLLKNGSQLKTACKKLDQQSCITLHFFKESTSRQTRDVTLEWKVILKRFLRCFKSAMIPLGKLQLPPKHLKRIFQWQQSIS